MGSRRGALLVWAGFVAMCSVWGTTWLAIRIGDRTIPPLTGVGLRFVIAGLFLYALAALRGRLVPPRAVPWRIVGVFAVTMCSLNYVLIYLAETRIDSGLAAVLFSTFPFFVFAFARVLIGERVGARGWIGGAVAFGGIAVIALHGVLGRSPWLGLGVVAAAAISAFGNVYAKRAGAQPPLVTLPPAMLLGGGVVLVVGLALERPNLALALGGPALGALMYLALVGSGVTFLLLMWLTHRLPAAIFGLPPLTYPLTALSAGALLGGEHVTGRELAGAALVVAGLAIALVPRLYVRPGTIGEVRGSQTV
jgi:drug/metabolite transporter (DMT)-like permease